MSVCGRKPGGLLVAVGPERVSAPWLLARTGTTPQSAPGLSWLPVEPGPDRLTLFSAGPSTLLLHGPVVPAAPAQRLWRAVEVADTRAVAAVVRGLSGAYVVVARFADGTECWGPVSGRRGVCWTSLPGGGVLVADRARVLAGLVGAELDDTALAVRLLEPVSHPLAERCCWRGVQLVPAGHLLRLESRRAPVVRSTWQPPEPAASLVQAAPHVAAALTDAVRAAAGDDGTITTELSGGYDSSTVTALAARLGRPGRRLVAITSGGRGLNNDEAWARRLASELPDLEHHVLPADRLPLVYDDLATGGGYSSIANLDEPSVAIACRAMVGCIAAWARDQGSTAHLTGHGGDHLFVAVPTLVRDLLRRRPVLATQRLAAYRAMFGWPLSAIAAQLADRRGYAAWLAAALEPPGRRAQPVVDERTPILDWGPPVAVPDWLTTYGRELILDALATPPAVGAEPLVPEHGRHAELDGIRAGARLTAAIIDLAAAEDGLVMRSPMFDDRLLEAVLSVRLEDRVDPWTYKPVLAAAVRGVVPDAIFARTTKDEGSADVELGLRRNAQSIRTLWSSSRLAERGLIDADRLSDLCRSWDRPELADGSLSTTIAAELWLRAQNAVRPGEVGATAGRLGFAGEDLE